MARGASRPLIGRGGVLAGLDQALRSAAGGRGQVAVLAGPAGIGKTRLAGEVARLARQAGIAVAAGRCDELERSLPFAPLIDLLRHAQQSGLPADLARLTPAELGGGLLPGLDGMAVVRAAANGLASLAVSPGLVLVVEDLHWCDESSALALTIVAKMAAELPVLLLLTVRPDEAPAEVSSLLAVIDRASHAREWLLAPLSVAETASLAAGLAGSAELPPAGFSERVHLITDGNPLFIEEVVRAVVVDGAFPDPADVDRVPVPRSVQAAVWARSRSLTPPARRLLQVAAVAGRVADVNVMAEVAGIDEDTLIGLLRELLATALVLEESADRIVFAHELTRRAVLADLLARERRTLHLVIAEVLERRSRDAESSASELARHFLAAEDWSRAGAYAERAGRHAYRLGAARTAAGLFTTAFDTRGRAGEPPDAELLSARAAAYERAGDFTRAADDLEARLRLARSARAPEAECSALLDLGSLWTARDYGAAGDHFRRALDAAQAAGRRDVLAAALNRVGNWHLNNERPDHARRHHLEALALYAGESDEAGAAATLDLLATVELTVGDLGAATRAYSDATRRFRDRGDAPALASALAMQAFAAPQYLGWPASWEGAVTAEEGLRTSRESIELCRAMGWGSAEALGHIATATVLGEHGRYREALEHGQTALSLADATGHAYWLLLAHLVLGAVHLDLLDACEARRHLHTSFEAATELGSAYWQRTACGFLVEACILDGDRVAAKAVADRVPVDDAPSGAAMSTMGVRHVWRARAELALAGRDGASAAKIVEGLRQAISCTGPPGPRFELLRGRALAECGQLAEAEAVWRAALTAAEGFGTTPVLWRLHAALGHTARRRRRLDEADAHLAAARARVDELAAGLAGSATGDEFARRAMARLPGPTPRRAAKARFAGLTAREQDVARLVTDGLTNHEIAARLVLSRRTVEKHVEHVLAKLGLSTRAHIAAWAVRAGLAGEQEVRTHHARSP